MEGNPAGNIVVRYRVKAGRMVTYVTDKELVDQLHLHGWNNPPIDAVLSILDSGGTFVISGGWNDIEVVRVRITNIHGGQLEP